MSEEAAARQDFAKKWLADHKPEPLKCVNCGKPQYFGPMAGWASWQRFCEKAPDKNGGCVYEITIGGENKDYERYAEFAEAWQTALASQRSIPPVKLLTEGEKMELAKAGITPSDVMEDSLIPFAGLPSRWCKEFLRVFGYDREIGCPNCGLYLPSLVALYEQQCRHKFDLGGRGEAAESEQNEAGNASADSAQTVRTPPLSNERPSEVEAALASQPQPPSHEWTSNHLAHVSRFLIEMYQTMVDPVGEFRGNIEELCQLLLTRAREDRERFAIQPKEPK